MIILICVVSEGGYNFSTAFRLGKHNKNCFLSILKTQVDLNICIFGFNTLELVYIFEIKFAFFLFYTAIVVNIFIVIVLNL